MRKPRFTEEQIIAILAEQERGVAKAEVCRKHGVTRAARCHDRGRFLGKLRQICQ